MIMHQVSWRGQTIDFELQRKKVKNINLNFKPDLTVMVSANEEVPLDYIKNFVKSKGSWIQKSRNYFKEAQPESLNGKEYVSGETFKYLGKQVRLKVIEEEPEAVKYCRGYLQLWIKDKNDFQNKKLLVDGWFRYKAKLIFQESLNRIYPFVEKYNVVKPEIMIRSMKARWGSCVKDRGIILLNFELIKAPKYCIDYVILHELAHFLYRNHDSMFIGFISAIMPDWKERKRVLDEEVIRSL